MSLSTQSFSTVVDLFHRASGIRLAPVKKPLVEGRLQKLAAERGMPDLNQYVQWLTTSGDTAERQRVIDKLTTNETYFFREPQHFDLLARLAAGRAPGAGTLRVWSAASSSGEEAYSIAMVLADKLGVKTVAKPWEIVGTDLSTAMVATARAALYPMDRARNTPKDYLKRFCMRGQGAYDGKLLIAKDLRDHVSFREANLMQALPDIGSFDIIFLRNVLIYFDPPSKADIVKRVIGKLKPDGLLLTGHAESLPGAELGLRSVQPAVYELA
ncbi:methylase of chemotaxis methyl-accepting protein [Burkholderiales bacterium JOSHI_001]|nr:methylase of chemotaxis methyl-accepting protein [Burkholderiales bacterium JOSHI_001]